MLHINNVVVRYDAIEALKGVSLRVDPNEIVAVLGTNGVGKSTLLRAISGLSPGYEGDIVFEGRALRNVSPIQIVERGIIHCPEGRQLFGTLTVEENVKIGASRLRIPFAHQKEDLDFITTLFPVVAERWKQKANTLSGGEQQMVAIARSLIARPRLLLLDEPTLGLSPKLAAQLFAVLPQLTQHGLSVLVVEQNALAALRICRHACILQAGRIIASGTQDVVQDYIASNEDYFSSRSS